MEEPTMRRKLWTLFTTMLSISAFTFGGGFVIVSLMQRKLVDRLHWLEEDEMLDMAALAQAAPGAIAVNASILVGQRVAGTAGIAAAVLGTVIPPVVIIGALSFVYAAFAANEWVAAALSAMQAGVAAVVVDVVLSLGGKVARTRDKLNIALMAAAFVASYVLKVNVVLLILIAAAIGVIRTLLAKREGRA